MIRVFSARLLPFSDILDVCRPSLQPRIFDGFNEYVEVTFGCGDAEHSLVSCDAIAEVVDAFEGMHPALATLLRAMLADAEFVDLAT